MSSDGYQRIWCVWIVFPNSEEKGQKGTKAVAIWFTGETKNDNLLLKIKTIIIIIILSNRNVFKLCLLKLKNEQMLTAVKVNTSFRVRIC